jgi:DNA mismatch repair protein MutH
VALFLAAEVVGIPVPQRFHEESVGMVGAMPPLWLGASAGLSFRLH